MRAHGEVRSTEGVGGRCRLPNQYKTSGGLTTCLLTYIASRKRAERRLRRHLLGGDRRHSDNYTALFDLRGPSALSYQPLELSDGRYQGRSHAEGL